MNRHQLIPVILGLMLSACATVAKPQVQAAPHARSTTITIANNSPEDMGIYLINAAGARSRIGTVQRLMSTTLVLPDQQLTGGGVQFIASAIGPGSGYVFPRQSIRAGSRVELVLAHDLQWSTQWVH